MSLYNANTSVVDWTKQAENLPQEMRDAKRWLLWKAVAEEGNRKPRKVPYYCSGKPRGKTDTPEDQSNLTSLQNALDVLTSQEGNEFAGLAFALGPDAAGRHWQGVDIDGLSQHPELRAVVDSLPGYVEYSPSGDGVHAIGYGDAFGRALGSNNTGIEAYCQGRYLTVTGNVVRHGEVGCMAEFVGEQLEALHSPTLVPANDDVFEGAGGDGLDVEQPLPHQFEELQVALESISSDDYGTWVDVGLALKTITDPAAERLWMEWSSTSHKFDAADAKKKWNKFDPTSTHWKHIFSLANQQGVEFDCPPDRVSKRTFGVGLRPISQFIGDIKPMEWLVKDHLEKEGVSLLLGDRGSGKSMLAIDWSLSVASATEWNGNAITGGPVFYLAGEGIRGVERRVAVWLHEHDVTLPEHQFLLSQRAADVFNVDAFSGLIRELQTASERHGAPALIVVDTLANSSGGADENSNKDMQVCMNHVHSLKERFGAHVMLVHHCGHSSKSKDRARGASCLEGAADHIYVMSNKEGLRTLRNTKMKDGQPPESQYFEIHEGTVWNDFGLITGGYLTPASITELQQKKLSHSDVAFQALQDCAKPGAWVQKADWQDAFVNSFEGPQSKSTKEKYFREAVKSLAHDGIVLEQDNLFRTESVA